MNCPHCGTYATRCGMEYRGREICGITRKHLPDNPPTPPVTICIYCGAEQSKAEGDVCPRSNWRNAGRLHEWIEEEDT